jgi:glycosyltransferase involved in cell wall biosynthesis
MTTQPKVSVITTTYNRAHYVREAIDSALAQTYPNVEIIVVDDGSTDETQAVLKGYGDKISHFYQNNQGLSAARNLGIKNSSGEYLAFLDDDDIWLPEKLELQVAYMEAHPEVGMVHADMFVLSERSGDSRPRKREFSRPIPSGYVLPELIQRNFILVCTALVRRSCLDTAGLFDPELRAAEDYNLWLRIARRFSITYMDRPLAICRLHTTNMTRDSLFMQEWHLKALKKATGLNTEILHEVGKNIVRFTISFKTAYMFFSQELYKEARLNFAEALRFKPFHWPTYCYYFACCLRPSWINRLRMLKRGFVARRTGLSTEQERQRLIRP